LHPFAPLVQSTLFSGNPNFRYIEAHAQFVRANKAQSKLPAADAVEIRNRRRSRRCPLDIPVYVYGHGAGQEPFHEEAYTLNVNANGALLLLSVPVREGQKLLLTNQLTQQDQDCRVIHLGTRRSRTVETGVAFPAANADFWHPHPGPEDKSAA
jgi:hypothetical protein